jgi:hypothetical protein
VGLGEMASPSIAPCFSIVIMAFAVAVCILAVVRDLQVRLLRWCAHVWADPAIAVEVEE